MFFTDVHTRFKAGGIVVRFDQASRRYLLVTATRHPDRWVFPKGTIEAGETAEAAAVREVREEAGVVASVVGHAGTVKSTSGEVKVRTEYFWMVHHGDARPGEGREACWCTLDEALARLTHRSSRKLLDRTRRRGGLPRG